MTKEEMKKHIENTSMTLENGIDDLPGELMKLDSEQIEIFEEVIDMDLYAWIDKKRKLPNFIIAYENKVIYCKWYFQASQIWNYLMEIYKDKS